ncbi:MAG: peptidylprolyl isomerase [Truepera sp.]|jgi:parvulin-like peptidyl-prolyl isomerase|nr:peptidylprolyl isomerase [Truepera sp.]
MTFQPATRAIRARAFFAFAFALLLSIPGALAQSGTAPAAEPSAADPVVIRLGSHEERASEIAWRFGVTLRGVAAQQGQAYSQEFESSLWSLLPYYLDQRVQEVALTAEAERRGITPDMEKLESTMERIKAGLSEGQEFETVVHEAGFPDEAALRSMVTESDVINQLLEQIRTEVSATVTEPEVRVRYLAERGRFTEAEQYCARHILVAEEAVAQEVLAQLEGGADFAELAAKYGTDATKDRGGDLGCFGLGDMIPEFQAAVVDAPIGQAVGPVASQFGYHVVLVYDHHLARVKPFDEVKDTAREFTVAMATQAVVDGIVQGAGVITYPENLPTR